jgi:hypothetical protein
VFKGGYGGLQWIYLKLTKTDGRSTTKIGK